jgi:hypothetical protein
LTAVNPALSRINGLLTRRGLVRINIVPLTIDTALDVAMIEVFRKKDVRKDPCPELDFHPFLDFIVEARDQGDLDYEKATLRHKV